jgi:membrane-associated phospholipid phosphatase
MLELGRGAAATEDLILNSDLPSSRRREIISRALSGYRIADWLTFGYLIFASVIVLIGRENVKHWRVILPLHLGLIALVALLAHCRQRGPRALSFLSHWYPLALFGFFFEEIHHIVHAIVPRWFDAPLVALDHALFGAHPTVWVERFSGYWLNEYMQLTYTTYLPLLPLFAGYLWWRGRRAGFETYIVSMCAAYYLCYVIYVFFPVEGPHHTLAHLQQVELHGGPFTAVINLIQKYGRVHGGAFPSTHVAGSVVVLISAYRFARRLGYALTPLVLSICVATVYGRYHYAVDVLAGAAMGALGCWLGARLCGGSERQPLGSIMMRGRRTQ